MFKVVIHKPHKEYEVHTNGINGTNERIYNILTRNEVPEKLAIEAASWAELAYSGESYNEEVFDIYAEKDDE